MMEVKEFICNLILKFDETNFESIKEKLVGEYLTFSFIDDSEVNREILAEKLYDYFEKLEIKTSKTTFLSTYIDDIDSIVSKNIAKEPQAKKNENPPPAPRARKYYNLACEIKKSRQYTLKQLEDYTRIMLCLYMASITTKAKEITDFEYALSNINIDRVLSAMKEEKASGPIKIGSKLRFNTEELYCFDTCTFIMTIIMYYCLKNDEIIGDY